MYSIDIANGKELRTTTSCLQQLPQACMLYMSCFDINKVIANEVTPKEYKTEGQSGGTKPSI